MSLAIRPEKAVAVITALKVNHPFIFVNHNFLYIIEIQTTSDIKRMNRRTECERNGVFSGNNNQVLKSRRTEKSNW